MHTATAALTADKLGDILVRDGLITADQLKRALAEQRSSGMRLGYTLVKLGFIEETEITKMLARQYRMPAVDLSRFEVDPKILKLISSDIAAKYAVLPLKREGRTLTIAIADPNNVAAIEDIKFITRCDIFPVIAGEYTLRNAIDKYYQQSDAQLANLLRSVEEGADAPSSRGHHRGCPFRKPDCDRSPARIAEAPMKDCRVGVVHRSHRPSPTTSCGDRRRSPSAPSRRHPRGSRLSCGQRGQLSA